MSGSVKSEHLTFFHVTRRSMENSMHIFGSIATGHLSFCHVNSRSMVISLNMSGAKIYGWY